MLALVSLFIAILISIIFVRIAAVAFELTGLSEEISRFQALSAFSGAGFTTSESEAVIKHPLRRKIAMALILLGNAGLATVVASLVLTFVNKDVGDVIWSLTILVMGLILILLLVRSSLVYSAMKRLITKLLQKYTQHVLYDYHEILGLGKGFVISKIFIDDDSWMEAKAFKDLKLDREGTLILSIERRENGDLVFHGAPNGKSIIYDGDVLTCYGRPEAIQNLASRKKGWVGDQEHEEQVEKLKDFE